MRILCAINPLEARVVSQTVFGGKRADGTGEAEKLYSGMVEMIYPFSSLRDGKTLALWELSLAPLQQNIGILSMEGDHAKTPLLQEKYNEAYLRWR